MLVLISLLLACGGCTDKESDSGKADSAEATKAE